MLPHSNRRSWCRTWSSNSTGATRAPCKAWQKWPTFLDHSIREICTPLSWWLVPFWYRAMRGSASNRNTAAHPGTSTRPMSRCFAPPPPWSWWPCPSGKRVHVQTCSHTSQPYGWAAHRWATTTDRCTGRRRWSNNSWPPRTVRSTGSRPPTRWTIGNDDWESGNHCRRAMVSGSSSSKDARRWPASCSNESRAQHRAPDGTMAADGPVGPFEWSECVGWWNGWSVDSAFSPGTSGFLLTTSRTRYQKRMNVRIEEQKANSIWNLKFHFKACDLGKFKWPLMDPKSRLKKQLIYPRRSKQKQQSLVLKLAELRGCVCEGFWVWRTWNFWIDEGSGKNFKKQFHLFKSQTVCNKNNTNENEKTI